MLTAHAADGLPEGFHYVISPSQTIEFAKTLRLEERLVLSSAVQGKGGE
jgi:hypothetical protein